MTPEEAIKVADDALYTKNGKHLTDIQKFILLESLLGKKYEEMQGYETQHIKNEGAKLWKTLSEALAERVSKTNFQTALERRYQLFDKQKLKKPLENQATTITTSINSKSNLKDEAMLLIKEIKEFLVATYKQQEIIRSEYMGKELVANSEYRSQIWNEFINISTRFGNEKMIEYKAKFKNRAIRTRDKILLQIGKNLEDIDKTTLAFYDNPITLYIAEEIQANLEEIAAELEDQP
ncbi:MAG: hypothetical protein KME59_18895 [Trichormus sp. ATA11-4-KO1]|jgi:gas vesicle protein|nr:hypothetical protein [Trichormus sp. ATA11-4-KO1]